MTNLPKPLAVELWEQKKDLQAVSGNAKADGSRYIAATAPCELDISSNKLKKPINVFDATATASKDNPINIYVDGKLIFTIDIPYGSITIGKEGRNVYAI